jgi:DNA topoisomerase-2
MNPMQVDEQEEMFFDVEQKTDKEHILDNPDTYIGSVEIVDTNMWVLGNDKIEEKTITYVPGLFKLFDEGIVNCRDHVVRMQKNIAENKPNSLPVTYIDVSIQEDGTINMMNDGNGIDVVMHPKYNKWTPELIFGHLRTSTNYNKDEKKIVGGKNGFGFKLVLVWSTWGSVETVDHIRGLKYVQEFKDNLNEICPPKITKVGAKTKPYTKISFKPDYQRLGLTQGLSSDMISLMKKRVFDISAITDKTVKVKYNGEIVPVKNFEQYINFYIGDKSDASRVYEQTDARWEYAVALTPNQEFTQVSFVNGIYTSKGGKHVEYIINQITRKLVDFIEKKKKRKVTMMSIKEQLILFLRCDIENPTFDSQTKDFMNTPSNKFGSQCQVSDKFIEKVAKMGVMDAACAINDLKENKAAKRTDGKKSKNIRGIPKLDDANWAGTEKSHLCTIFFCEGDSAKTAVISGLSAEDRNTIGVYPLKGKPMNVRGENIVKINENKEISEIKQIVGLESGKSYDTQEEINEFLRYGKMVFLTDQDYDGSHIKGLCVNLFHSEWHSLTKIEGFVNFMITPILKARKHSLEYKFYNEFEYEQWKKENATDGWKIKYYKGLGTSTKKEFKEYFQEKKFISFQYTGPESDNAIDFVFNKQRSEDRKHWLENIYDKESFLDTNKALIPYEEFINKELIHFSKYDCDRSIPKLMDGLKISLRKILFCSFKKNLTNEIKVAQFSGYVSENSCYHHGEESLNKAIIGMAQNFMGSNNINLLVPSGQFGSRIQGGKDHSSPRYIFTRLEKITRCIFPAEDDRILEYLNDDGTPVEPTFYVPIIPMVLVNGSTGVGTGFSTEIMCYNPLDIITYLEQKLTLDSTAPAIDFLPYYEGFTGEIIRITPTKFMFKGKYEKINENTIRVTELPVGVWTEDFINLLESLKIDKTDKDGKKIPFIIKETFSKNTDTTIDTTITFVKGKLAELEELKAENGCNGLEKKLKLVTTNSTTNMNLFDVQDKLKKYGTVDEIIDDYYVIRLAYYQIRKNYLEQELEYELMVLTNKVRYIEECLNETIDLRKKSKEEIFQLLNAKEYAMLRDDNDFKYLIKMPMDSVSEENIAKLKNQFTRKSEELEELRNTTIEMMWLKELGLLKAEYENYRLERKCCQDGIEEYEEDEELKVVSSKKHKIKIVDNGNKKKKAKK